MNSTTVSCSPSSLPNAGHGLRAFAHFAKILGILAALVIGTGSCLAGGGGVVDNGAFFSEQAKSDATKMIAEMERTLRKDLSIETFKEIPASAKEGVNMQDKAAVAQMFKQWALKQAKQKGVNGVYVLLSKEPAHLESIVGNDTQKLAFTLKDRDALVTLMLAKLRAHQNDDALRDGVNFVSATMKSHTVGHTRTGTALAPAITHAAQSSPGSSTGWILQVVIVGLVVWLIIGVVRAIFGRMGAGAGAGAGQMGGGGGGGFLSSLVGGMFGAAAGMWMYDQFFSNHGSNSAYGSDRNDVSGGDSGFTGQDSDYNSSGGDFGGSDSGSSGGDWGGGGDSGGGDSGGGGDF